MKKGLLFLSVLLVGCGDPAPPDTPPPATGISGLDTLYISIGEADFAQIAAKRDTAMMQGRLPKSSKTKFPAQLTLNGEAIHAKLRLKGDLPDHWKGNKWSFRIESETDVYGHQKFSVQDPATRNGAWEWLFHETMREAGNLHLDYRFVYVVQNGVDKGVYALESHFTEDVWEDCGRPPGTILCYDENDYWKMYRKHNRDSMYAIYNDAFMESKIKFYSPVDKDKEVSKDHRKAAKKLLKKYRSGKITASQAFDPEKMANYMAGCQLFNAWHGLLWGNMRFYYNPETALLEPITFDGDAGFELPVMYPCSDPKFNALNSNFYQGLCQDSVIVAHYNKTVENWSFYSPHLRVFNEKGHEFNDILEALGTPDGTKFAIELLESSDDLEPL